jgi:multiple sugar transport system permease protein
MRTSARTPWIAGSFSLTPALIALVVFVAGPALAVIAVSVTDWSPGTAHVSFVGLDNYRTLLASPDFQVSVRNTLALNSIVVPASFAAALALALAITSLDRGAAFWQTIYFLPVTSNLVAMAVVWDYLLHPELGFVGQAWLALGWQPVNWLNDRSTVLWVVGAISSWQLLGYYVVLFVAGLMNIPPALYEAARMDGARRPIDRFVHVTWPMLAPTSLFVLVITVVKSLQIFDVVKVLTRGGPDKASEVILHTFYQEGFVFFRMGRAASIATLLLAVMLALTWLQMRAFERRVHYR